MMKIPKIEISEKGWADRLMDWVLYGSRDDWTEKYRKQHYEKYNKKADNGLRNTD